MTNPITVSATRLRLVLFIGMALAVTAIVALVIFGVRYLDGYAAEVNETVYQSSTSNERLALIRLQADELDKNRAVAERARQIVAESKTYMYQDVIIRDLQSFADKAGIRIVNFNFINTDSSDNTAQAPADSANPAGADAAPDGAPPSPDGPALADPSVGLGEPVSQLKSTTVNITLDNPVNYRNLLQFIHYIEQNLTKMQISSISLSGATESSSQVTTDSLTIEVYIR